MNEFKDVLILVKEQCTKEYCNECQHFLNNFPSSYGFCNIYNMRMELNKEKNSIRCNNCKKDQLPESDLLNIFNSEKNNITYFIKKIQIRSATQCSFECDYIIIYTTLYNKCSLFNMLNDKDSRCEKCIQSEKDYLELVKNV